MWRSKSMLSIIPIEIIAKMPKIQQFLLKGSFSDNKGMGEKENNNWFKLNCLIGSLIRFFRFFLLFSFLNILFLIWRIWILSVFLMFLFLLLLRLSLFIIWICLLWLLFTLDFLKKKTFSLIVFNHHCMTIRLFLLLVNVRSGLCIFLNNLIQLLLLSLRLPTYVCTTQSYTICN